MFRIPVVLSCQRYGNAGKQYIFSKSQFSRHRQKCSKQKPCNVFQAGRERLFETTVCLSYTCHLVRSASLSRTVQGEHGVEQSNILPVTLSNVHQSKNFPTIKENDKIVVK